MTTVGSRQLEQITCWAAVGMAVIAATFVLSGCGTSGGLAGHAPSTDARATTKLGSPEFPSDPQTFARCTTAALNRPLAGFVATLDATSGQPGGSAAASDISGVTVHCLVEGRFTCHGSGSTTPAAITDLPRQIVDVSPWYRITVVACGGRGLHL